MHPVFKLVVPFLFYGSAVHRDLHSFPTRRSSDLVELEALVDRDHVAVAALVAVVVHGRHEILQMRHAVIVTADRKSTRLNSSHRTISYAVFCLKKKKTPT